MKKGFFKKGTALAISAAMAVSMLPTLNPIEKVDAATTSESTKTITGLRIAGDHESKRFQWRNIK